MPTYHPQPSPTWRDKFTRRPLRLMKNARTYAEVPWDGDDPIGHLPQKWLGNQLSPTVTVAYSLLLDNGLIAGYFWQRERSLLLLVLLHLFALPHFVRGSAQVY